jgi:hypothetical protein
MSNRSHVDDTLRAHGIDPILVMCLTPELLLVSPSTSNAAERPTSTAVATLLPRAAASSSSVTRDTMEALPTSINFPTNAFYRSVTETSDLVLHSRSVLAVMPQLAIAEVSRPSDRELEAHVCALLQKQIYRPLPVLEELDRDMEIQRRALQEHAAYTERCEFHTLYPLPGVLPCNTLRDK